ncbi:unnamed protein product [Coffea canephora]|uniref:HAT C-terminal dimerisation domain-containing protein n=1 Tax=Coffea canephora TaxID=49390 RepID=A0A068V9J6_COFCA|nr:unnamed protein product [Coffea canephora]
MRDGWNTRTKHPIINFMVYCDRHMIYHSSVDCTNVKKIAEYIFKLMDEVVEASVKSWKKIWEVNDNRWYNQLHYDLHVTAYFLNPILQYSRTCEFNLDKVRKGLKKVIAKLEPNLDAQVDSINESVSKIFTRFQLNSYLYKHLNHANENAPNLRNIAVKILSQTCTSSGCKRNWSTWSLIHTKLRNRLAVKKLHKLVFVHYNMRLKVKILMHQGDTDDFYNPIDLNHIFHQDDILDDWIRENEQPTLPEDNLDWLDKGIHQTELESSEYQEHDNDGLVDTLKQKSKTKQTSKHTISSSSNKSDNGNDDDDNDDNGDGGNNSFKHGGGYNQDSQQTGGMSWAQGQDNYYATQDTDHGYRPGIEAQHQFLNNLT